MGGHHPERYRSDPLSFGVNTHDSEVRTPSPDTPPSECNVSLHLLFTLEGGLEELPTDLLEHCQGRTEGSHGLNKPTYTRVKIPRLPGSGTKYFSFREWAD